MNDHCHIWYVKKHSKGARNNQRQENWIIGAQSRVYLRWEDGDQRVAWYTGGGKRALSGYVS